MTVELILAGIVGLVAGVLIALWLDSQTLVRRVQEANAAKSKAHASLQRFKNQHQSMEQQLQIAQNELTTAVAERTHYEETIAKQLAEIEASREQLQASIQTNDVLKENLQDGQARLEELEAMQLTLQEELDKAAAENNRLLGDVQLTEGEIVTLEAKIDELAQMLEEARVNNAHLVHKVEAAEMQLSAAKAETEAARTERQKLELTAVEQKAKIEGLLKQLEETQGLRKRLDAATEKLQTADSRIQALQGKMEDVQTKMSYSGKNQLQLIRGIGPTYANRLNDFGIQTFADLAECTVEQIADIIKKKSWQAVDIQDWLDEAKALAARLGPDG